jgi:hypothetical protein
VVSSIVDDFNLIGKVFVLTGSISATGISVCMTDMVPRETELEEGFLRT